MLSGPDSGRRALLAGGCEAGWIGGTRVGPGDVLETSTADDS